MREIRFRAGETIFSEGDPSDHCYKIVSGAVEIRLALPGVMRRGRSEAVATCGPGELIGEMSLLDRTTRSASAVAVEPTVCLSYTAEEFVDLLESDPREAMAYVRVLVRRIRGANRRVARPGA